jgi:hypothetical protein
MQRYYKQGRHAVSSRLYVILIFSAHDNFDRPGKNVLKSQSALYKVSRV